MKKNEFESMFLSGVDPGTRDSKVKEAIESLKATRCKKLILDARG